MPTRAAIIVTTLFLFLGGLYLRFNYQPALPPKPPRPPRMDLNTFRALDYSPNLYRAKLEHDAAEAGVPLDSLNGVFRHDSTEPSQRLEAGGPPLTTRDLDISLRVETLTGDVPRGRIVGPHLIMRIENRTDHHLAYRILTTMPLDPRGCIEKVDIPHNAVALAPREVVERTECGRDGIRTLTVDRVETVELPPLAYVYVSQVAPVHIGLDGRETHGHRPARGSVCTDIPEQAIARGIEKSVVSFRDVIDFYARHDCHAFIFPVGYHAFTRPAERTLPVSPQSVKQSP